MLSFGTTYLEEKMKTRLTATVQIGDMVEMCNNRIAVLRPGVGTIAIVVVNGLDHAHRRDMLDSLVRPRGLKFQLAGQTGDGEFFNLCQRE